MELNTSLNVDLFQNFLGVIFESENDANGIKWGATKRGVFI